MFPKLPRLLLFGAVVAIQFAIIQLFGGVQVIAVDVCIIAPRHPIWVVAHCLSLVRHLAFRCASGVFAIPTRFCFNNRSPFSLPKPWRLPPISAVSKISLHHFVKRSFRPTVITYYSFIVHLLPPLNQFVFWFVIFRLQHERKAFALLGFVQPLRLVRSKPGHDL